MKNKVILVTGNAGFIGSHLTEALLKKGFKVVGVDNFNDYYDPKIKEKNIKNFKNDKNFKGFRLDITDLKKLEKIFLKNKFNKVVHLAARAGVRPSLKNPKLYYKVNVKGTENLLKLSLKHKVSQFVLASSSSVYGKQKKVPFSEKDDLKGVQVSPYAKTKFKAEKLCQKYAQKGLKMTVLRFFTVYGPRGRPDMAPFKFTDRILKNKPIIKYGDGSSLRDYTYIEDIVKGIVKAIDRPFKFEIINLGNNQPVSLNKFMKIIEDLTYKKFKIINKPRHPADVKRTFADIKKAKSLLDWQPKTEIKRGIKKTIDWIKSL